MKPVVLSLYRSLLRLAAVHDAVPSYKFLLSSFRINREFAGLENSSFLTSVLGTKKGTSMRYVNSQTSIVDAVKQAFRKSPDAGGSYIYIY